MIAPTAEVREQHRFDVAALERYLDEHIAGFRGPLEVRQFGGGQRDRALRVVVREAGNLHSRGGMVERSPQIDRERLIRLLC